MSFLDLPLYKTGPFAVVGDVSVVLDPGVTSLLLRPFGRTSTDKTEPSPAKSNRCFVSKSDRSCPEISELFFTIRLKYRHTPLTNLWHFRC
jgi:hypothetical protein